MMTVYRRRAKLLGFLEGFLSADGVARGLVRHAEHVVSFIHVWREGDGALQLGYALSGAPEFHERCAQAGPCDCRRWVPLHGLLELLDGQLVVLQVAVADAKAVCAVERGPD